MSFKSLAKLLPFSRRATSVLVCETDGFTLRGAVISRVGDSLEVLYAAKSEAVDFKVAVSEVVATVRKQGWSGKTAVLLTLGTLSTLIDLPVAPNSKRPPEQILELVRWELEPLLMQHSTLWSVGRILVGLGYLTEAQASEVLEHQQGRKGQIEANATEIYSFKRYGEMAIEMGFINHRQMEECLTRQAWLQGSGEDIACGWVAQPASANTDAAEDGHHPWLVCGVNQGMMQRWAVAFATSGVLLEYIYPLAGCAATAPELVSNTNGDVLLIEVHAGLIAGVRVSAGAVVGINLQQSTLSTLDASMETYHVLTPPDVHAIWLASTLSESDDLVASLTSMLRLQVNQLSVLNGDVTPSMVGAARNALQMSGATRACAVSVQGPKLPLWNQIEFRAIVATLLLLIGVGAAEVVLQLRQNIAETEAVRVGKVAAEMDQAVSRVQVRVDAIKKLQADIKAKNEAVSLLQKRIDLLSIDIPKRSALVLAIFSELSRTVSDEVVIDRFEETPNDGFRVTAWSLSEKAAQQFVKSYQSVMEPMGYKVVDVTVGPQIGRLSLQGYILRLRLVYVQS